MPGKESSGKKQFRDYTKSKIKVFTFLNKKHMFLSYYTYLLLLKNHFCDCILTLKTRNNQTSELKIPSPGGERIQAHTNKSQGVQYETRSFPRLRSGDRPRDHGLRTGSRRPRRWCWCLPSMAAFTLDKKLVEAKGLTPDIEVGLDIDLFKSTGQDTQLDRALQFIRTGN